MHEIFKGRLLRAADNLEKVPENLFNFRHYVGMTWSGKSDLSCGTTACGLGHLTTMAEFRELGLILFRPDEDTRAWVTLKSIAGLLGRRRESLLAAEIVFGLEDMEFDLLFVPSGDQSYQDLGDIKEMYDMLPLDSDATPKQLAEHIREFIQRA